MRMITDFVQMLYRFAERRPLLTISVVWLAASLPGLGSGYLVGLDETYYASCAQNMALGGSWLVPEIAGEVFLEKPPLAYWGMAAAMKVFGAGEFAARLPSTLWGLLALLGTYGVAAGAGSRRTGLVAAAILGSSLLFSIVHRAALTDAPMVAGVTLGLLAFWLMDQDREGRARYPLLCLGGGVAIGAAVLSKGPVGLLPGVVALLYMALRRDFGALARARWRLVLGFLAIIVVAAPWYVLVSRRIGSGFYEEFILKQNLGRMGEAMQGHEGPFWYYLPVVLVGFLPWSPLLVRAGVVRRPRDRFDLFLACWVLVPLVIFSITATTLPHYSAVFLPPLALFAARELEALSGDGGRRAWVASGAWILGVVGALLCLAAIAGVVVAFGFPWLAVAVPGAVLAGGAVAALRTLRRPDGLAPGAALLGAALLAGLLAIQVVTLPASKALHPIVHATQRAVEAAAECHADLERDGILWLGFAEPTPNFYSGGRAFRESFDTLAERLPGLGRGETLFVICRHKHRERFLALDGDAFVVTSEEFRALDWRYAALEEATRDHEKILVYLMKITRR